MALTRDTKNISYFVLVFALKCYGLSVSWIFLTKPSVHVYDMFTIMLCIFAFSVKLSTRESVVVYH